MDGKTQPTQQVMHLEKAHINKQIVYALNVCPTFNQKKNTQREATKMKLKQPDYHL